MSQSLNKSNDLCNFNQLIAHTFSSETLNLIRSDGNVNECTNKRR